ncbi:hypothetical protein I8748_23395 [Nostoc sp. CENA67]|uniref:Uncharacterized protein n=1 Tax=Amazonocrinis nigriterrae CENA67 TaxID=2794033 RepID=A0A8J7HSW2_9NOST|nr:hypothetical protein [Amazonocrinis nigriterrae]MBH8565092.1 hypothetical protein [Amazonocrinis nigriterrae CENA67]
MQANTIATSFKTYIPVQQSYLKKIVKAMKLAGIAWDGTVNQIDIFCLKDCHREWRRLTPNNRTKNVVYIQYVY